MMSGDRAPSRPASTPVLPLHRDIDCWRPVKVSKAVGVEAAGVCGGGRASAELDVSYSRDEVVVCREMVLVSLVEGCVRSSGVRAVLYKCHMCGRFMTSLGGLTRHMATHGSASPPADPALSDVHLQSCSHTRVPTPWSPASDKCNGHADTGDVVDSVLLDDVTGTPVKCCAAVKSATVVDSSQAQAEDLSKPASLRRQRPASARRRGGTTEPLQCRRPSQRLAFVSSEMLASDQASVDLGAKVGELASEIRAKEHLDDDVTVVIPSDAPLDFAARADAHRSDTPVWWSCSEDGKCSEEIAHAPVKSIMGHPHVHRKARLSAPAASTAVTTVDSLSATAVTSSVLKTHGNLAAGQQLPLLNVNAESLQLGTGLPAMFGPLALSTFVHGFGGLVAAASPFLSYYTHMPTAASLASLMAVTNAPLGSPTASNAGGECAELSEQQEDKSEDSPTDGAAVQQEEASSNESGSSGWTSDALTTGLANPVTKCSSLSRTHSRLNVVRRPIKREDACRPVVLADGRTAFRCFYCKKDFCTISDVNRHMDFHEDIRPYKCRFCNYYARTNSQLKVHMMRHQGIREYMCRLCNYKGVTQSDLNRHTKSQIHLMKARNECVQCSEGFVSPMNLEQHRQDKHPMPNSSVTRAAVVTSNADC